MRRTGWVDGPATPRVVLVVGAVAALAALQLLWRPTTVLAYGLLAGFASLVPYQAVRALTAGRPWPSRVRRNLFAFGATWSVALAVAGSQLAQMVGVPWFVAAGLVEELVKITTAVIVASHWGRFRTPTEGFVAGVLVGAGFAWAENIAYFVSTEPDDVGLVYLVRGFVLPFAHPFFTALGTTAVAYAFGARGRIRHSGLVVAWVGITASVVGHAGYNAAVGAGHYQAMVYLAVLPFLAGLVYLVAERRSLHQVRDRLVPSGLLERSVVDIVVQPNERARVARTLNRDERVALDAWTEGVVRAVEESAPDAETLRDELDRLGSLRLVWDRLERDRQARLHERQLADEAYMLAHGVIPNAAPSEPSSPPGENEPTMTGTSSAGWVVTDDYTLDGYLDTAPTRGESETSGSEATRWSAYEEPVVDDDDPYGTDQRDARR